MKFLVPNRPVLAILAAFYLSACHKPATHAPDHSRAMNQSRVIFRADENSPETKKKLLSGDELSSLMMCDEASTSTRLKRENYSISHTKILREQKAFAHPVAVTTSTYTYKTEDDGALFTETHHLPGTLYDGNPVPGDIGILYVDTCIRSEGCDSEKRDFIQGDPVSLARRGSLYEKNYEQLTEDLISTPRDCHIETDEEGESLETTIQRGTVHIAGEKRVAVKTVSRSPQKLVCAGTKASTSGYKEEITIVLADKIPRISGFSDSMGCARTMVFSSFVTMIDDQVHYGESRELVNFSIEGEIQSADEWDESQETFNKTTEELESTVTIAEARFNESHSVLESALSTAQARKSAAESTLADAELYFNQVNSNANATEQEKQEALTQKSDAAAAVARAEVAYNDAVEAEADGKEAMEIAEENLVRARRALENHLANRS